MKQEREDNCKKEKTTARKRRQPEHIDNCKTDIDDCKKDINDRKKETTATHRRLQERRQ